MPASFLKCLGKVREARYAGGKSVQQKGKFMDIDAKIEELKQQKKIRKSMREWKARFENLRQSGLQLKQFCEKHGFDDSHLCHQMAGRRGATPEHFNAVEKALKGEGV